jgi:preprotein translocase subunit SecA
MAGRGTDILLGGNPEALTEHKLADENREDDEAYREELLSDFRTQCAKEKEEVLAAGGLAVIGTERHESRRIDNQLRGRSGRQGDPGASRFYLSLEDDLLRIFMGERVAGIMERLGFEEDVPIESGMVTRSIENAQKKVEGHNFDARKNVIEYDDVMNQQRKTIYSLRKQVLRGEYVPTTFDEGAGEGQQHEAEAPTESGDWTIESLSAELKPEMAEKVEIALDNLKYLEEHPEEADDIPVWRQLRNEIWRQTGAFCEDMEFQLERLNKDELTDWIVDVVARSLIQQRERLYDLCDTMIGDIIDTHCPPESHIDDWDFNALSEALKEQFNQNFELSRKNVDQQQLAEEAWNQVEKRLEERMEELGRPWLLYFARHFTLEETDNQWIEHLKNMDHLREGIGLRGYAQKDPKKEYKREGYDLFRETMRNLQSNAASNLFRVKLQRSEEEIPSLQQEEERETHENHAGDDDYDAGAEETQQRKQQTVKRDRPKVGRNDPCPCGSGKKYKKCHGRDGNEASL